MAAVGCKRYKWTQDLGRGSFGNVILATDEQTGQQVAVKQLAREFVSRYVETEILNHCRLRHPHIIGFREVYLSDDNINIVMDYASGGALFDYVKTRKRLREPVARWFFQQLMFAVDYCHRKGVTNRDIKLDNLLLQPVKGLARPLIKVCDFGYSKQDERAVALSKILQVRGSPPRLHRLLQPLPTRGSGPLPSRGSGRGGTVCSCGGATSITNTSPPAAAAAAPLRQTLPELLLLRAAAPTAWPSSGRRSAVSAGSPASWPPPCFMAAAAGSRRCC
ncbi:Ser Thr kinase [Raphidocelis subcapitata]|uniref:Ser Thr kinase n=1 Tax=Raphidocelis subcapitata TaxID=307507 RepID=A0A2V0P7S4_9CHLO|nr:Ser Thr kinase [Raphidocelis subcapitata]|eukprot:GBF95924.1 Ser Thr kinase [Raphidocelis subcapitata]